MITYIVNVQSPSNYEPPFLEDVQVTIGEETRVTDVKGNCLFKNIKPGIYDVRLFKEGFGCVIYLNEEIKSTPNVQDYSFGLVRIPYLKLTADKTKIKKNETVTIVAKASEHLNIRQIGFNINGVQKVMADYDTDRDIAVMTLKGSNQGKVQITAHAPRKTNYTPDIYSNVLYIQDGDEE